MSRIEFYDATEDSESDYNLVWKTMGSHMPFYLYFGKVLGFHDDNEFLTRKFAEDYHSDSSVIFRSEFLEWLKENCKEPFIDWPTLGTIQFTSKSDAVRVKLVWG